MSIPTNNYPQFRPYTNIQPFTTRDGATYLLQLESLVAWIKNDLVPHIDKEVSELVENWETQVISLVTQVEEIKDAAIDAADRAEAAIALSQTAQAAAESAAALAEMYASQAEDIQDAAVTGILEDTDSALRTLVDGLYAGKSIEEIIITGRLSTEELEESFADKSVQATVEDGRLSVESLGNEISETASMVIGTDLATPGSPGFVSMDARITERIAEAIYTPGGMGEFADWIALYESDELEVGPLSSWGDGSGNGYNLTQERTEPCNVVTWMNGQKAVKFEGSPLRVASIPPITGPVTVVMVADSPNYPGWFFGSSVYQFNRASGSQTPPGDYRMGSTLNPYTLSTGVSEGNPHLFIATFDGANSSFAFGQFSVAGALGTPSLADIRLGGWTSPANDLNGHIAACGIVAGRLTQQQITNIRDWASSKYGVL